MTVEQLKNLLNKHGLSPNKVMGQNFLLDEDVLDCVIDAAGIQPGEIALEVGPGIGNWTARLAQVASAVLAVEKDAQFKPLLRALAKQYPNVRLEFADILKFDFVSALSKIPFGGQRESLTVPPYKVVANLPYYLTGKAFQLFLRASQRPKSITVLVQKEVAENIVVAPGRTNLLALSVQLVGTPRLVRVVPAGSFYPSPKVDSAVLHIDIPSRPMYPDLDEKAFFRVARACFSGKRKQIHNTLAGNLHLPPMVVAKILESVHIDPATRPQELGVDDYIRLSEAVFRWAPLNT